jgi:hypothetical protein
VNDVGLLERAWAVLTPPRSTQYASYPLELHLAGSAVRVALDREGTRHLLVPTENEAVTPDTRPSVLQLAIRDLHFGDGVRTYVDLSCTDRELYSEFDEVVEDVLDALAETDRPGTETVRTVSRWRRLFKSQLFRGLSLQAKVGLFAELSVLSSLLERDPKLSVECWTGPLRKPHDFEATARCLEVKGIGADSDGFVIHGLEQLATHDARPLDLVVITVEADPEGTSLEDLVAQLRERVSSRGEFRRLLNASGWSDDQTTPVVDYFSISSVMHVEVGEATPCVVPDTLVDGKLPPGVSDVNYRLDLGELSAHASGSSLSQIAERALP